MHAIRFFEKTIMKLFLLLFLLLLFLGCAPSFKKLAKAMDNPSEFEQLLDQTKNIDKRDRNQSTLLSAAVWKDKPSIVKILMERGADPLLWDNGGRDALDYAGYNTDTEMLEIIYSFRPDLMVFNEEMSDQIQNAIWHFESKQLEFFLDSGLPLDYRFATGRSLLAMAMNYDYSQENNDVIMLLLERGANPNSSEADGKTPLFFAGKGSKRYAEFYDALAKAGCDFDHLDEEGHTAAYYFALNGKIIPVLWMLQLGHIPNEEYYVQEFVERSFTTETTEWVYHIGKPRLKGQHLTREQVSNTTTLNDEYVYPLMEFVKRKYPDHVDQFIEAGYPEFAETLEDD